MKSRVSQARIDAAEAAWWRKQCDELRGECGKYGLAVRGVKADLVARLRDALFEVDVQADGSGVDVRSASVPLLVGGLQGGNLLPSDLQSANPQQAFQQINGQQPAVTHRPEFLSRLAQSAPKAYQSPYATSGSTSDKSAPAMNQPDIEIKSEPTPRPAKKRGRPRKAEKSLAAAKAADSHPDLDLSPHIQQATPLPTPSVATDVPADLPLKRLTRAAIKERELQSASASIQARPSSAEVSHGEDDRPDVQPIVDLNSSTPDLTSSKDVGTQSRARTASSPQDVADLTQVAVIEAEPDASPKQIDKVAPSVTAEAEAPSREQITELPPPVAVQLATSIQQTPELSHGVVDTEKSVIEHFRKISTPTVETPPRVQNSGNRFAHNVDTLENDLSQPTHRPPTQLPSQMPLPHPHPSEYQGYLYPPIAEQSDFGAQMQLPHAYHDRQTPYPYSPSMIGGRSNFSAQPFSYTDHAQNTAYQHLPYQTPPPGHLPFQPAQQGIYYQPQPQAPPLGYFSSASSPPGFPTPTSLLRTTPDPSRPTKSSEPSSPAVPAGRDVDNQTIARKLYKSTLLAEIEAMEETLERFSSEAAATVLPDITARLFVSYDNVVGNLTLSKDKTQLTFRALDQDPSKPPTIDLHASQIKENPIVSMKKSRPMELRIKYEDNEEEEILCRFYFGQTEAAFQAANELRAAIVTGRIICRATAGQTDTYQLFKEDPIANIEIVKPWECETCKKRFKNREGLKYHQSKSNTACNPNFDPSTKPRKPEKVPKLKKDPAKQRVKKEPVAKKNTKRVKKVGFGDQENHVGKDRGNLQNVENDDASDSDPSSDDSIILWAEKVAFANPGSIVKSAPPTPKKQTPKKSTRRAPTEEKLLSEMLNDAINSAPAHETADSAVEAVLGDVVEEVVTFTILQERISLAATFFSEQDDTEELSEATLLEQVNHQRSRDIILDLVNENFGIFPGDKALWFAFVGVWLKHHARSSVLPLSSLCDETLQRLVQDKRLVVTTFPGGEDDSMAPAQTIVTLPTVKLDSPAIEKLKELVQMAYPRSYVPSRFAPSAGILERLQGFIRGPLTSDGPKTPRKRQDYSMLIAVSDGDSDYESSAEGDYYLRSEDVTEEDEEDDIDDDYYEDTSRRPKQKGSVARKRQGQRIKDSWAASKAVGSNVLTKVGNRESMDLDSSVDLDSMSPSPGEDGSIDMNAIRRTTSRSRPSTSRFGRAKARPRAWKGGPIPPEEKERRRALLANRVLNLAPRYLPDEGTGAWSQTPLHVKPDPKSRSRVLRYQLPEVITYLQSENGAWESRAYGHGSPPIHCRPARRADGNPGLQVYLKKISQGHRPILQPAENATRVFLPAPASKVLLRAGISSRSGKVSKAYTPTSAASEDDSATPRPTKRSAKRKLAPAALESDGTQHTPKRRRTHVLDLESTPTVPDILDQYLPTSTTLESPSKVSLRVTRKSNRGGHELDEIQKLDFFKPRLLSDFEKSPNPGLASLPSRFWVTSSNGLGSAPRSPPVSRLSPSSKASVAVAHTPTPGLKGFEKVAAWEQGPAREMLTSGGKTMGLGWINHTVDAMEPAYDTETMKLIWHESAAFKIEDLPYGDLDDSEEREPVEAATQMQLQDDQSPRKRQRTKASKKKKVLRRRRLTAWRSDFDGVVDNIDEARAEFEVELAPRMAQFSRAVDGTMSSREEARLLVAVIVVMTLTGGVEKSIDWALVAGLFPRYAAHHLRKVWARMLRDQKARILALAPEFQEAFLAAYEAGEVPKIDYDRLVDYDWAKVIDWAEKKVSTKGHRKDIVLPSSRKEFKKLYDLKIKDNGIDKTRESFFNPSSATYKRMEIVAAIAHTLPAQAQPSVKSADDIEIDDFTLARSWIRALVFTPEEDYDKEVAHEKLLDLGDDLVQEAKQALVEDKVIRHQNSGRAAPGRVFEPTEVFHSSLRHHITEKQFVQAVAFKRFLDAEFASGKEFVRSDYLANEGTVLCVTNLQAYGRITLKAVDVPMKPFGLTDGGYETSKIPKERFRINMLIYPSSSYLFDEEIPELQHDVEPPRGGEAGEIPLWYGITEDLIPDIWKRAAIAVVGTTALRAGASVASLESTFKPALEGWEIWRLMEWGVSVGMMKRLDEAHEGWTTGEWWWAIVGKFCSDG